MNDSRRNGQRGFIVPLLAISLISLVGLLGLGVDIGRVYIVKNEAQAFADLSALAAARHLNGKSTGLDAARAEVANSSNRWNFATQPFTRDIYTVDFANAATGPWAENPAGNLMGYAFVRVTVRPKLSLAFLPLVGVPTQQEVRGRGIAGLVKQTFPGGGYMPFTPFAHNPLDKNFGFIVGQEYAFHWPGNVKNANGACLGDRDNWPNYNVSAKVDGSDRGYFELQSASAIRDAILGERQMSPLSIGSLIELTNGNKQAEKNALEDRAHSDTDQREYPADADGVAPLYTGNGSRLVLMPVNDGKLNPDGTVKVVGFAAFLLPVRYDNGGNKTWCAIYMGSKTAGGGGAGTPFEGAGAYVVRLLQ